MVEYSDILAHVKKLFPEKDNSELTKMSYSDCKYGNIKDISEISQKIKRNTNPKKKKNLSDSGIRPTVYIAPQNQLKPLKKEEVIGQKAEALLLKKQKRYKEFELKKTQVSRQSKKTKKHMNPCNHSYDDIIAESRGRCINGTFVCKRCGKTRHIGYKYKGYINICLQCKQGVCKKSCGSIWAIYTPMK